MSTTRHTPTHLSTRPRRTGRRRLGLVSATAAVVVLFGGAGLTAAAYTDQATANLGTGTPGSGLGNPNKFDIAVRDAAGIVQDADTEANAVVLPLTSGTAFSEATPVEFSATVENRASSMAGALLVSLYDPDPSTGDLWANLRFTVYLGGSATPAISDATAAEVNSAALAFSNVPAGGARSIRLSIRLATGTGVSSLGQTTQVGLRVDGQSA